MEDSEDESGDLELWRLLPQLKDLPEALLRKLPVSAMFQLNTALAKEKKTSEKLGINSRLRPPPPLRRPPQSGQPFPVAQIT